MRGLTLVAILSLAMATKVAAQCAFDAPVGRGTKMVGTLVPAHAWCLNSTTSIDGVPACPTTHDTLWGYCYSDAIAGYPLGGGYGYPDCLRDDDCGGPPHVCLFFPGDDASYVSGTTYKWADAARCSYKITAPRGSNDISLNVRCRGVLNPDGTTLTSHAGWNLHTTLRWSISTVADGAVTLIDFPATWSIPAADRGRLDLKAASLRQSWMDLFGETFPAASCQSLQVLSIEVSDPAGRAFARPGLVVASD